MARVLNVVPQERALRPLMRAVRRVASAHSFCPKCGSDDVRRSLRRTFPDAIFACLFLAPFRCRKCRVRYYRFWRPALKQTEDPPRAPVLMMPRQMLGIDSVDAVLIDHENVESETIEAEITQPERPLPRLVEAPPSATPPVRFIRSRSVLILESDLSIRKLLRRLLDRRGYFTHEVLQLEDLALELRERRVDLLIVDTLHAFSFSHLHPNLKILALSSELPDHSEFPDRCLALTKPFSLESFLDSVDNLLEPATPPE